MNQELMTLDFWQDTVIYEGKTFPIGTLACDTLNVPADTIAKMNEQCEKINLLLGMLNAGQDASALFPMAREAALTMLSILSKTPPFSYMNIVCNTLSGSVEVNQISATSRICVPENAEFTAVKKGIGTSILYEMDGKKAEDFSAADSENVIELNGMKSELVICRNE